MEHRCPDRSPSCAPAALCPGCYGRELVAKRGGSRAEHRGRDWPETERAVELARSKVGQLAADPRVRAELARACLAGAAAWWARRPARYR